MLSTREFTQQDYWKAIKGIVRRVETAQGVIKIDDTIQEKPHATENSIICWHYDHSKDRRVKEINVINFVYQPYLEAANEFSLPVAFEIVDKTEAFIDPKSGKVKRRSEKGKNEIVRSRLHILSQLNKVKFQTVL